MALANLISFADRLQFLGMDRLERIDSGSILVIPHDAIMGRISPRGNRCAIHLRRARINRVMMGEGHPLFGEPEKRRRILFGQKIRAHPVPNHHHDMMPVGDC